MTIDHIAMYVNELEAVRDFFVTYFRYEEYLMDDDREETCGGLK